MGLKVSHVSPLQDCMLLRTGFLTAHGTEIFCDTRTINMGMDTPFGLTCCSHLPLKLSQQEGRAYAQAIECYCFCMESTFLKSGSNAPFLNVISKIKDKNIKITDKVYSLPLPTLVSRVVDFKRRKK